MPGTTTAEAASSAGAAVSFSVYASDTVDEQVPVGCDRASGSMFPVGSTTVHCDATDAHANTGAREPFAVVVMDTIRR